VKKTILLLCCFYAINTAAQINHKPLDDLLKTYVSNEGAVNYTALKSKKKEIETIINAYSKIKPSTFSKDEQLAFYINVYNLHTIYKIVSKMPVKSIKNLDNGKPWDVKNIVVNSTKYSLNDIENNIIRPNYKDARIHFALNCGALSCPSLLNEAYTGTKLVTQMDSQTKKFINNKKYNSISGTKLNLSKIFDWYKVDFGNVCDFLNKYCSVKINQNASITYMDYDWNLNGK
jgi:hypothetical protein